ncbi:MAG: hypothetical protein OJF50_000214 [Nitrospira sp.]|nr:hypothetical protein [Nitrospira sp.]
MRAPKTGEPATPHSGSREVRAFLLSFLSCRVGWLRSPPFMHGDHECR